MTIFNAGRVDRFAPLLVLGVLLSLKPAWADDKKDSWTAKPETFGKWVNVTRNKTIKGSVYMPMAGGMNGYQKPEDIPTDFRNPKYFNSPDPKNSAEPQVAVPVYALDQVRIEETNDKIIVHYNSRLLAGNTLYRKLNPPAGDKTYGFSLELCDDKSCTEGRLDVLIKSLPPSDDKVTLGEKDGDGYKKGVYKGTKEVFIWVNPPGAPEKKPSEAPPPPAWADDKKDMWTPQPETFSKWLNVTRNKTIKGSVYMPMAGGMNGYQKPDDIPADFRNPKYFNSPDPTKSTEPQVAVPVYDLDKVKIEETIDKIIVHYNSKLSPGNTLYRKLNPPAEDKTRGFSLELCDDKSCTEGKLDVLIKSLSPSDDDKVTLGEKDGDGYKKGVYKGPKEVLILVNPPRSPEKKPSEAPAVKEETPLDKALAKLFPTDDFKTVRKVLAKMASGDAGLAKTILEPTDPDPNKAAVKTGMLIAKALGQIKDKLSASGMTDDKLKAELGVGKDEALAYYCPTLIPQDNQDPKDKKALTQLKKLYEKLTGSTPATPEDAKAITDLDTPSDPIIGMCVDYAMRTKLAGVLNTPKDKFQVQVPVKTGGGAPPAPAIGVGKSAPDPDKPDPNANRNMIAGIKTGVWAGVIGLVFGGPIGLAIFGVAGVGLGWAMAKEINS